MRRFDCVLFFNEVDVLELRLAELDHVVDVFVVCEGTRTFQGDPRELVFPLHHTQFDRWADKIRYVVFDDDTTYPTPWHREASQRNYLMTGIADAADDDQILISDVDEIPNPTDLAKAEPPASFSAPLSYYWLNCRARNCVLRGTRMYERKTMRTPQRSRHHKVPIQGQGWHFSYLGGVEAIRVKLQAFSHVEYATDYWTDRNRIAQSVADHKDLFDRRFIFDIVPLDGTFPATILTNLDRWKEHIA